jgi:hypothetical protein
MKPSEEIQRDLDRLVAFRNTFINALNASERDNSDWLRKPLKSKGSHQKWVELQTATAHAAGAAAAAYRRYGGGTLRIANGAYIQNVDPVANWKMSFADTDVLDPLLVVSSVDAIIGAATTELETARSRERGLVGVVAAFLRWPRTLREAVGPGRAPRAAAGAIGILGQILVGTVSGALAVGLVTLVVWLASNLWGGAPMPIPTSTQTP